MSKKNYKNINEKYLFTIHSIQNVVLRRNSLLSDVFRSSSIFRGFFSFLINNNNKTPFKDNLLKMALKLNKHLFLICFYLWWFWMFSLMRSFHISIEAFWSFWSLAETLLNFLLDILSLNVSLLFCAKKVLDFYRLLFRVFEGSEYYVSSLICSSQISWNETCQIFRNRIFPKNFHFISHVSMFNYLGIRETFNEWI